MASRPVSFAAGQLGPVGSGTFAGLAVRETSAAAGVVRVYDGTSAAGVLLAVITVAASGSGFLFPYARYETGVFVQVVSGVFEGSVYIL